jgi:MinD-like ATPase involved in chromosome partitioning or flagellar assembly
MDNFKRITIFMGHYGSGKTFVSVNYAIALKLASKNVEIYDLDIVNPYFRTIDAKEILSKHGIHLTVSPYAQTNVDLPAMNAGSYKMIDDLSSYAVVDVGGDDRGALALGRFSSKILDENNYDVLWVVNSFRPETRDIYGALEIKREIESVCDLKFTGIVNNTNLGLETTIEHIKKGYNFCLELSKITGLPVKFSSVRQDLITEELNDLGKILPVEPIKYGDWL